MTTAYLGIGGNLGDRQANLERAVALLKKAVEVRNVSPLYETAPVGFANQPDFLNAAIAIETTLPPRALLEVLQNVERQLGKATPFANGPRTLDLDLLLYGSDIVDEPGLRVPHPRMHERRFVLTPLVRIAPDFVHPVLHQTLRELLSALPANGVRLWQGASPTFPTP